MDHNPYLKSNKSGEVSDDPARGRIEYPENIVNIPWQTRPETPTDYEQELTETLSQIFEADVDDLASQENGLEQISCASCAM